MPCVGKGRRTIKPAPSRWRCAVTIRLGSRTALVLDVMAFSSRKALDMGTYGTGTRPRVAPSAAAGDSPLLVRITALPKAGPRHILYVITVTSARSTGRARAFNSIYSYRQHERTAFPRRRGDPRAGHLPRGPAREVRQGQRTHRRGRQGPRGARPRCG